LTMILTRTIVLLMRSLTIVSGAAGLLLVTGCAGDPSQAESTALTVAAAFYPLQYVAEAVGGENVNVIALASPGVEPHDLELSPSAVRELGSADLALYLSDFQPAVDDAIASTGVASFDAATAVTLLEADHAEDEDGHEGEEDEHGALDPHFWLDPSFLGTYATAVGDQFAEIDPANAETYTANAAALVAELTSLDESFTAGLAQCARRDIVTSHEAFAYLAARYELEQIGIAGIDPETEPSPARLLEVRDFVQQTGTTTIFTESAVNASVAETIANETGATVAVLDPVEFVLDEDDYATVMARNLESLRGALACE
jgi:zinc transport system substrate-binding protein